TITQAVALEKMLRAEQLDLSAALDYELPREEIIARLSGRRTCSSCKAIFHLIANPPLSEGVCDKCGAQLFQRDDDRPESIRVRLQAYEESTKPLIDFYRERGLLVSISAEGPPGEVLQRTLSALKL
ncbi:MAG TPA: nucleoside monophosphate kinase, partial [Verrucomicrobiae bacterium]|nr:nucleoside monophosphate kinase [Verrucomicrobiae bacterium]